MPRSPAFLVPQKEKQAPHKKRLQLSIRWLFALLEVELQSQLEFTRSL